jgi:NAD(P)-dependent dehydrogenase (short-subunit alcohol dehydrogenase family)
VSQFVGKVALVTGGTSGIGAAVARGLLAEGATVIVTGRRRETFDRLQTSTSPLAGSFEFIAADVARTDDVTALFRTISDRHGRLDFAINSAGVFDRSQAFHDYEDAAWESLIAANMTGVFKSMRAEVAMMVDHGGVIINIASVVAQRGSLRASPAYVAAKHAVLGLTRQAAVEYASRGIRVNSISPGPTLTSMAAPLLAEGSNAAHEVVSSLNPTAKFIDPATIAATAVFLCSNAATHINGADFVIDGGQTAQL